MGQHNQTNTFHYVATLNLIGNLFGDDGANDIVVALDHPFSYTDTILLGRNGRIGDKTAIELARMIETSNHKLNSTVYPNVVGKNLTWLELGGTSLGKNGIITLYQALGIRPFSYLGLEYMEKRKGFFSRIDASVAKSLEDLDEAKYLQSLTLTGNALDDEDMAILANKVVKTNVSTLTLWNNKIGPSGVLHLVPLTKHLKELALGDNRKIRDEGAIILSEALKDVDTTLENLSLNGCHIGQTGAEALLSIFPENKKIKFLSLTMNDDIEEETLQALELA